MSADRPSVPLERTRPTDERVRIRLAMLDDDAALLALDRVAWPPGTGFPSFRAQERTSFFDERNIPEHHLVAEVDGKVVGYVRVVPASPIPEAAHVLGIYGIAVAEPYRGHGVGSALLRAAEREARARGARKLILNVLATNPTAQRLYERHGFVVEGRHVDAFFIHGRFVDDIAMAKHL